MIFFRCTAKTLSINHAFYCALLSAALFFIGQPTVAQLPITEPHLLSDEAVATVGAYQNESSRI